jgi:hypothetical protein
VLGQLMRSLSWWKLVPDQTVFSSAAGQNTAARSSDSTWVLVYLPANTSVTVKLDKIKTSDSATAWWVDPTAGTRTKIGTYTALGTKAFTAPNGWQDAVLLLLSSKSATAVGSHMSKLTDRNMPGRKLVGFVRHGAPGIIAGYSTVTNIRGQRLSRGHGLGPEGNAGASAGVYILWP